MSRNITFDLIEHARERPAAPALLLPGRTISYGELDCLVWRYAWRLHELGARPGQIVGLTFSEEPVLVLALLALARLGATACSIPRSASARLRRQVATRAGLHWLASDQPERYDAGVPGLRLGRETMVAKTVSAVPDLMDPEPAAPWLLISGSGSTGSPKLMQLSHSQARARAALGASCLQLTQGDRVAALSHFDFAHSKYRLLEALATGAAYAPQAWHGGSHSPRHWADLRLDVVCGTVFHANALLAAADTRTPRLLAGLRTFELSASTVSHKLRQRVIDQLTPQLHVRYGSNETGPISIARPDEVLRLPGTVGRAPDGVTVRIVDRSARPLPAGTVGLIQVSSTGLVSGYQDDVNATAASFKHGGFLPGDIGRLTLQGELVHHGRADHMMIVNGMNLHPAEIEQLMCDHPAISDAIALPVRDQDQQDIPVCAVARKPGHSIGEEELLGYAREHLGALAPRRIAVLDALRSPGGKVMRADIERLLLDDTGIHDTETGRPRKPQALPYRQRVKRLVHLFTLAPQADLQRLDVWLEALPGMPDNPPAAAAGAAQPESKAAAWLGRALLLTRWLLQAASIPVFDTPQVKTIAAHDVAAGSWRAVVAIGLVDQLPTEAYSEAMTGALALCDLACRLALTEPHLQAFYARADLTRARLRQLMPAGKSTLPLLRTAHEQGIAFCHLGAGIFQLGWGSRACRLDCSMTGLDSAIGAKLAQSKVQTARLLRLAGLPAPEHRLVHRMPAALAAAQELGWPVVIKPADLERGEGVTVDVSDEAGLRSAFATAQRLSPSRQVLVERQVPGWCHRLFIAKGRLLYAVKRLPISVTADGRNSIAELVEAELRAQQRLPPWMRSRIRPLDDLGLAALAAAGLETSNVPAAGMRIALRRMESTAWGGVDEEVSSAVHPENLRIALAATRLLGLEIAGIDLITPDIGRPWHENGAIINEVNHSPQLGGGEISRSHIPELLDRLLPEHGRIPIEIFVGGEAAWTAASLRWQQLLADGLNAYLSSATLTLSPSGEHHHLPWNGSYRRARALALSAEVDAMVLAVPAREFACSELPFESVDRIVHQEGLRMRLAAG